MKLVKDIDKNSSKKLEVSDKQAEEAFRTLRATGAQTGAGSRGTH